MNQREELEIKAAQWKDIKLWSNELYTIKGESLTKENFHKLRNLLLEHNKKGYYNFTAKEGMQIVIDFKIGELYIEQSNNQFKVSISSEGKKNVEQLKNEIIELQKIVKAKEKEEREKKEIKDQVIEALIEFSEKEFEKDLS